MATFEIASSNGDLGACYVTCDNVEKHRADFSAFFEQGTILDSVTVTVSTGAESTVSGADRSNDCKLAIWFVNAAAEPEECDVTITVETNDGQTLAYKLRYIIGAPIDD